MIEQTEILKYDSNAAAQCCHRIPRERRNVVAELGDQTARRL
jgi:hypothetical protein